MRIRILRVIFGMLSLIGAALSLVIIFVVIVSGLPAMPHQTRGTIVGYERELTGRGIDSLRYFPVVDYIDASGDLQSFRSWSGLEQPSYATGTIVRVVYSPSENPKQRRAEIVSPASRWAAGAWLFWVLAVVAFVSIIPLVVVAYAFLNGRGVRELISSFGHAAKAA